jgi:hypothetical protein
LVVFFRRVESLGLHIISAGRASILRVKPNSRFLYWIIHLAFNLWEACLVFSGAFCSSSYLYLGAI